MSDRQGRITFIQEAERLKTEHARKPGGAPPFMACTALKVTEAGVVLFAQHRDRLAKAGGWAREALARFALVAQPGCYTLTAAEGELRVEVRPDSRLVDGMPVRTARSPVAGGREPIPKPPRPSSYDPLRVPGLVTLLTSADGTEILEACSSAVVGWDGRSLVFPPLDRPRVWSTSEQAIRAHLPFREAPLAASGGLALLLVNAIKGTCTIQVPGRPPFPQEVRAGIDAVFIAETARSLCTAAPARDQQTLLTSNLLSRLRHFIGAL